MFKLHFKQSLVCAAGIAATLMANAQIMAQDPLFSRTAAVEPNIVFMFDDSGSMLSRHLYQFGGGSGGYGKGGPDNISQNSGTGWVAAPTTFAGRSPDVNRIYYDPRTYYKARINADGTSMSPGPTSGIVAFDVYFYKAPVSTVYSVANVGIASQGSGYPASGVTATFNSAPIGGVTALATATTSQSVTANSVTLINRGSNYPNSGVTAIFSAPPAGGVQATGTVTTAATNKVGSAALVTMGSGYPATGVTATFSAPQQAGGAAATGTPVVASRLNVASVTVTNPGTGYPTSGKTVSFTAAPAGGVTATGTVSTGTLYNITGVTLNAGGNGYTSAPSVAISGPLGTGGTAATGTATLATRYSVNSVAVTSPGTSNYASAPAVTFTGTLATGGTAAAGTAVLGSMSKINTITVATAGSGCGAAGTRPLVFGSSPAFGAVAAVGTATIGSGATAGKVTTVTVSNLGAGYSGAPSVTIGGCTTAPTFNVNMTSYNGVASITVSASGSGYTSAPTATFSGGSATVTANSYQAVGSVTVSGGTRFTAAPTISFSGGGGSGASASLTAPSYVGVTGINITNPGSGYIAAPTATIATTGGGSGATFSVVTGSSNVITGVTINDGGSGYSSAPTITFGNTGSGSGANFTAVLSSTGRWISSIAMTNKGSGYTSPPTLTLGNTGSGSGASWTVDPGTTYGITAINVTRAGSGYFTTPVLTIVSTSGTGVSFTVNTTPTIVATVNRIWDGNPLNPNPNTSVSYFTPSYLPDSGSPLAALADATRVYPNTASGATPFYPKFLARSDCKTTANVCTWAEELQNYANWYTYHSTRTELAKTGIGLAFQPLNPTFRLGWGTINDTNSNSRLQAGVQLYNSTTKANLLNWLYNIPINGGTPNRIAIDRVGKYYQRGDDSGPWADSPPAGAASVSSAGSDVTTHASCRRSYSLLMTDGYYNESFTLADVDTTVGSTIGSYQYVPVGPYSDKADGTQWSNTFADVAMKYWGTDLRPTLPNKIKPNSNDPAFWQHMNFYAIGLGVIGEMDATSSQLLQDLTGSTSSVPTRVADWPQPVNDSPKAIDDMWHATINGRGKIFNAKTTQELTNAIGQMLSDVAGAEGTQAGVAVSTASLNSDTKKYTPSYTPITWTGNVTAYSLDGTTAAQLSTPAWQVETLVSTDTITGVRTYASKMPLAVDRNIYVGNGATSGTPRAVPFTYADMGSTLLGKMNGTVTANLINYLRGDTENEDVGTTTTALYRARQTRLGDVVNSTPVFVKSTVDLNYQKLPSSTSGQSTYRAFVDGTGTTPTGGKKQRAEGLLIVGANDGMLHAFRDGVKNTAGDFVNGGVEAFAYVPNAILPSINKLADKAYVHQYYVDGPLMETDAYLSTAGRWANMVLGTTGGGAGAPSANGVSPKTGVFAIDTTSINTGPTGMNASSVLWEVSSSVTGFEELGYVLTELEAGPTLDGKWVGIFGNGYESKSCHAQLFIVNLETGTLIKKLDTGVGSGNCADKTNTNRNGLGGVRVVRDSMQQIIGVYGGDLQGNLWKFSLNDSNPTNWKVDLAGAPLFKAGSAYPITAAPSTISLTLTSSPSGGYMVVFGSGKFFELDDITSSNPQSLFGIWDPVDFGVSTGTTALTDRSRLVQQTISSPQVGADGNTYFSISANAVDYTATTPKRGWYIDLPNTGQRMVYPFELLKNRFVLADTISPANVSLDPCSQTSAGTGYLYLFDALTGGGPQIQIFDTNGDGNIDSSDLIVSGVQGAADGKNKTIAGDSNASDSKYFICSAGETVCRKTDINCSMDNSCPVPGNPTIQIDSREWRQIFMR